MTGQPPRLLPVAQPVDTFITGKRPAPLLDGDLGALARGLAPLAPSLDRLVQTQQSLDDFETETALKKRLSGATKAELQVFNTESGAIKLLNEIHKDNPGNNPALVQYTLMLAGRDYTHKVKGDYFAARMAQPLFGGDEDALRAEALQGIEIPDSSAAFAQGMQTVLAGVERQIGARRGETRASQVLDTAERALSTDFAEAFKQQVLTDYSAESPDFNPMTDVIQLANQASQFGVGPTRQIAINAFESEIIKMQDIDPDLAEHALDTLRSMEWKEGEPIDSGDTTKQLLRIEATLRTRRKSLEQDDDFSRTKADREIKSRLLDAALEQDLKPHQVGAFIETTGREMADEVYQAAGQADSHQKGALLAQMKAVVMQMVNPKAEVDPQVSADLWAGALRGDVDETQILAAVEAGKIDGPTAARILGAARSEGARVMGSPQVQQGLKAGKLDAIPASLSRATTDSNRVDLSGLETLYDDTFRGAMAGKEDTDASAISTARVQALKAVRSDPRFASLQAQRIDLTAAAVTSTGGGQEFAASIQQFLKADRQLTKRIGDSISGFSREFDPEAAIERGIIQGRVAKLKAARISELRASEEIKNLDPVLQNLRIGEQLAAESGAIYQEASGRGEAEDTLEVAEITSATRIEDILGKDRDTPTRINVNDFFSVDPSNQAFFFVNSSSMAKAQVFGANYLEGFTKFQQGDKSAVIESYNGLAGLLFPSAIPSRKRRKETSNNDLNIAALSHYLTRGAASEHPLLAETNRHVPRSPVTAAKRLRGAITARGLMPSELLAGKTREGVALATVFGSQWDKSFRFDLVPLWPTVKAVQAAHDKLKDETSVPYRTLVRLGIDPTDKDDKEAFFRAQAKLAAFRVKAMSGSTHLSKPPEEWLTTRHKSLDIRDDFLTKK